MKVIKEYAERLNRCVIRTDTYNHTVAYFDALYTVAKEDFANLKKDDVNVVLLQRRVDTCQDTFGIVFTPNGDVPPSYTKIQGIRSIF